MKKENIINELFAENSKLKNQKAEIIEIIEDRSIPLIKGVSALLFGLMQQPGNLSAEELKSCHCLLNDQLNTTADDLKKVVVENR